LGLTYWRINLCPGFCLSFKKAKNKFQQNLDKKIIKEIIFGSLPYGLLGILGLYILN